MTKRKKVLIADDEVDLCLLMKTYFLRKNYEVYISHSCDEVIIKAKELQPDFIFISKDICNDPDKKIQQLKVKNLQLDTAQKQRYWLIAGLILLLLVAVLLFIIYTNKKQTAQVLDEKNKMLSRLNTDLEEANETKAKLFSIISHDLRSPISQVYQFLKLQQLNPQLHNAEQKQQLSTRIQEATGSLLETMEDLLLWSKTQMSQFNTQMQRTALYPVVSQCEQLLKLNTDAKGIRIKNTIPEDTEVFTDPYFLQSILRNLLQNAIKASPENEVVGIECIINKQGISVLVTNKGIPFSQHDYEQVLSSDQTGKGLSGLGLRLVDELSAKLNVKVRFSVGADDSTTAEIHFPIVHT
ncbi:MAG: hybrid sensor histidine kinase/response regulator [Pedobacter sp.]|nr:MAG: hybrid sensor histidine kinase/response regulator [Pedobacter sp.]